MAENSKIEWTDATWNPVRGCSLVSPGCTNCYAMKVAHRFSGPGRAYEGLTTLSKNGGPVWTGDVRLVPEVLDQPIRWRKPRRVFVNSMSDLFHEDVPDEFIDQCFAVMAQAPHHVYQVLTKRPARMRDYLSDRWRLENIYAVWYATSGTPAEAQAWPLPNVWLGVSVEDQQRADERIPLLLRTPAAVRFLSCEPLLGRVDLAQHLGMWWNQTMDCWESTGREINRHSDGRPGLGWIIVGGESGTRARPMQLGWVESVIEQCDAAGVPCFVKQLGSRWARDGGVTWHDRFSYSMNRDRKGGNPTEWPDRLRVREFPA